MGVPTLRQLEYAVALADHLHFGEAALAANVSQPALSAQIRELEARLGVELFERRATGTTVTAAGMDIVARARDVLSAVGEIERVANAHHDEIRGPFHLAAIPTIAPYLLPTVIERVQTRWPDAHIVIEELQTSALVAGVESGELDLGLLATPVETGRLRVEPLWDEPFCLAVRSDHELAQGEGAVSLSVLAELNLLLLPEGHCLSDHARQAFAEAGRAPHSEVKASSIATLARMVAAGMGATLLPASAEAVEVRAESGIATRRFVDPAPGRTIALAWRETDPRQELFQLLVKALRSAAPQP